MTTRVWRISHRDYSESAFSGEGAKLFGGRFNSPGIAAVYTSGALSLSMLELLLQIEDREYLNDCVQFYADIPDKLIYKPRAEDLPDGWSKIPYGKSSQKFGDDWINDSTYAVLRIPSVVVPVEYNYVINPIHPEFEKIELSGGSKVELDPRLS